MSFIGRVRYRVRAFPSQLDFYALKTKYRGFSGPIGSGKSYALCYMSMQLASLNRGCVGLIGAPTYPMLRDVTIPALLALLDQHRIPYTYRFASNSVLLHRSKSKIIFRSLEKYDRLRGTNLAWFGIDELTYCKREAFEVLQGRLRDPRAVEYCGFAVWTPKGFDWVYDAFVSPVDQRKGFGAIRAKPGENKAVLEKNPGFYDDFKHSYDEKFYRQEILGEYLNCFSGRVYHAYEDSLNDAPESLEFNPAKRLCWALDFNYDPMSSVLTQDMGGRLHVIDELSLRNCTVDQMCDRFIDRIEPLKQKWQDMHGAGRPLEVAIYGDFAGNDASNKQTGRSDYALMREYFRRHSEIRLDWNVNTSNPPVKDRVASVNRMLCDAAKTVRVTIDKRCKELRADFLKVSWKQKSDGYELDKHTDKMRTHMSDAFGYQVYKDYKPDGFKRELIYK